MTIKKIGNDLYAFPSKLGTIIKGTVSIERKCNNATVTTVLQIATLNDYTEDKFMHKMWELEAVVIKAPGDDEISACKKFQDSVSFSDGKYSARLPWIDDCKIIKILLFKD